MILKFLFDRVVAAIGLLFLWPVLLVVAILVKVKMPGGPAFFVQKRVGKGGKLFNCHKFRTMTVKHSGSTVSVAGDSRITPLGAKLRHYKLDELPGLWDVLIGNMSFVGPRPDVPGYADKFVGDDRDVLKLRPGITGPATLKYRLEDEMLSEYVAARQAAGDNRPMQEIAVEYKRKNGLKIENLGSLEQKRVYNGEILKKCSIIDDYLKNIQYLCSVNAVIIIRKEV